MAQPKRSRSPAPEPEGSASLPSATAAVRSTIRLLSSLDNLPADLYDRVLDSLRDAHTTAAAQEQRLVVKQEEVEDERAKKRVKVEGEQTADKPRTALKDAMVQTSMDDCKPPWPAWVVARAAGETSGADDAVSKEVEAALPLLDELGFILRPSEDPAAEADREVWEAFLPMPDDSNWAGAIFKPKLLFTRCHPEKNPRVKMPLGFFHPNTFPSGTIAITGIVPGLAQRLHSSRIDLGDGLRMVWSLLMQGFSGAKGTRSAVLKELDALYSTWSPLLRIPLLLEICRLTFAYENLDDPSQLEPYQMAKKQPNEYKAKVSELALEMQPSAADNEAFAEASRRAAWRKAAGQTIGA
ncbi:hypothetical protein JCM10207_003546 [Rhodosporidiobolus poonsookiae]